MRSIDGKVVAAMLMNTIPTAVARCSHGKSPFDAAVAANQDRPPRGVPR